MNKIVLGHVLAALEHLLGQKTTQAALATFILSLFPSVMPASIANDLQAILQIIAALLLVFPEQSSAGTVSITDPAQGTK